MVSVLLATTGRPDMAEHSARQLIATTADHPLELVAAVDHDPETSRRLLSLYGETAHVGLRIIIDESRDYRGCSKAWNDALRRSQGDPVVLAADDLTWHPGWLDAALQALQTLPDGCGLVGFNDGHHGPELSTHYLASRRFIVEHCGGVIAWEHYSHSFNDMEINERARLAGRYAWCENAHVTHQHWIFGDRPQDPTDTRHLGGHGASMLAFQQRQALGFPNDYEPVIAC